MADKTVTVGSSTGGYASLNAALAGEIADLTSGTYYLGGPGRLIINCHNTEDTASVNQGSSGWTSSTAYYVLIQSVDDHNGTYGTTAYRLKQTGAVSNVLTINQSSLEHVHLKGLQIWNGAGSALAPAVKSTGAPSTGFFKIEKCIIAVDDSGNALRGLRFEEGNITYKVWNTVVYGAGGSTSSVAVNGTNGTGKVFLSNCTIDSFTRALDLAGANYRVNNCRLTNITKLSDQSLHADSDYNLTDNSTSVPTNWGTNSIDGGDTPTINYVDSTGALASRDYHVASGDSGIGAGQDLSSSTGIAFTDDIDGDTRG